MLLVCVIRGIELRYQGMGPRMHWACWARALCRAALVALPPAFWPNTCDPATVSQLGPPSPSPCLPSHAWGGFKRPTGWPIFGSCDLQAHVLLVCWFVTAH